MHWLISKSIIEFNFDRLKSNAINHHAINISRKQVNCATQWVWFGIETKWCACISEWVRLLIWLLFIYSNVIDRVTANDLRNWHLIRTKWSFLLFSLIMKHRFSKIGMIGNSGNRYTHIKKRSNLIKQFQLNLDVQCVFCFVFSSFWIVSKAWKKFKGKTN